MTSKNSTAKEVIELFGEGKYLTGKTAIVTGGNSGIGLETCKALASAGCKVILCSRSVAAGEAAIREEILQSGHGGYTVDNAQELIVVKALDLESLKSIKAFADEVMKDESLRSINMLVLNAGIMALPTLQRTKDAEFEKQIGVNHFGHFYLTMLLLDKMAPASRVVVLSSVAHAFKSTGVIDVSDLHYTGVKGRKYAAWPAYAQSKAANILFAKGLARKLQNSKYAQIAVVSLHPGEIQTNLWRASLFNRILGRLVTKKSIPQGAATTIYACVCPRILTPAMQGAYLSDCSAVPPHTDTCRDPRGEESEALWKVTAAQLQEAVTKIGLPDLPTTL